jgi:hypothetical protein
MINHDYIIDISWHDSGGYCDFLPIKNHDSLGFKAFKSKTKASDALKNQQILSEFDLAPMPISDLCKLAYDYDPAILDFIASSSKYTGWGFVTERASLLDINSNKIPYCKIQRLVDKIWTHAKIKFWDCHELNVGYIKRGRFKKLVCIDTGKESFDHYSNAWGFIEPGPKCPYCNKFQCLCCEY